MPVAFLATLVLAASQLDYIFQIWSIDWNHMHLLHRQIYNNKHFLQSLEGLADLEEGFSEENLQMIVSMDGKDLETALAASKTTILWPAETSKDFRLHHWTPTWIGREVPKVWFRIQIKDQYP